jgi:Ca-activated chloride channel family protein
VSRLLRSLLGVLLPVVVIVGVLVAPGRTLQRVQATAARSGQVGAPDQITLRLIAGSELEDVLTNEAAADFLDRMRQDTGIRLKPVYFTGSLSGAEALTAGAGSYDLAWFASDAYLRVLAAAGSPHVVREESIIGSPVVLGVKRTVAQRYGWLNGNVSWRDIVAKVPAGFTFGMSDPAASNSGLAALVEAAVAVTGHDELGWTDIPQATGQLQKLLRGVKLTAESSGWLADEYLKAQADLDGLVNYESRIRALNDDPRITDPLEIIRPADGVVTASYPLMLLNGDAAHLAAYDRLAAWLRADWAQQWLVTHAGRSRITAAVGSGRQLQIPADKNLLDQLLVNYQDTYRKPPRTVYLVDLSGSMAESVYSGGPSKLDKLRAVFHDLADDRSTSTARFHRFRTREKVTILPFSVGTRGRIDETIGAGQAGAVARRKLTAFVDDKRKFQASGETALYDALYEAYALLDREVTGSTYEDYIARKYPTIVLLTDGESNAGMSLDRFRMRWSKLASRPVRVFSIHFGPQSVAGTCSGPRQHELCAVAKLTGGRVFDTSNSDLLDVFREIRGYE